MVCVSPKTTKTPDPIRKFHSSFRILVPTAGLEPARPYSREILSLMCLPFHHVGTQLGGATIAIIGPV